MENLDSKSPEQHEKEHKSKKFNPENSPDNEKFDKSIEEFIQYIHDKRLDDAEIYKLLLFFTEISKKNKYQSKILSTSILIKRMKDILLNNSSNPEISYEISKIIMNIAKNHSNQSKLIFKLH